LKSLQDSHFKHNRWELHPLLPNLLGSRQSLVPSSGMIVRHMEVFHSAAVPMRPCLHNTSYIDVTAKGAQVCNKKTSKLIRSRSKVFYQQLPHA